MVEPADLDLFSREIVLERKGDRYDVSPLDGNDFAMAIFPGIGMTYFSLLLANLRICPIQIALYGHPVTSDGAEIDYFIGGAEVEPKENTSDNYSERLVLLPGLGVGFDVSVLPSVAVRKWNNPLIINCSWSMQKTNYDALLLLRGIIDRSHRPIRFQFFPNQGLTAINAGLFQAALETALGAESVQLRGFMPRAQYLEQVRKARLTVDSYPFGGFNTVIDSLRMGVPVICREGQAAPSRFSAAVLRRLGLNELIAHDAESYISIAARFINDDAFRTDIDSRLSGIDVVAEFSEDIAGASFLRAVRYLLGNHEALARGTDRSPITITAEA